MTIPRDPAKAGWFKTARSKDGEDCVEVNLGNVVGVRDTKDRPGGQLAVTGASWAALTAAVKTEQ
jgi:hypothetical protein